MSTNANLIHDFGSYLTDQGKGTATVGAYKRDVKLFSTYLSHLGISLLNADLGLLKNFKDDLLQDKPEKNNSIRRNIIGIRQFYRYLFDSQKITSNPFDQFEIPKREEKLDRVLKPEEVENLMNIIKESGNEFKKMRDLSILYLLAFEGVKTSELVELKWSDFLYAKALGSLKITGPKPRIIQLRPTSADVLVEYRNKYRQSMPYNEAGARMFIGFSGRDVLTPSPKISRHGIKHFLYELGEKADYSHLNSEMLRHFAISYHLNLGFTNEEIMAHFGFKRLGNIAKHIRYKTHKVDFDD